MFAPLAEGFARIMDPWLLLMCFAGTFAGTLVGVLPGLGPSAAIAVLLPLTFGIDPLTGLVAMAGIYYGAMYGGTITSVLLNVPGESASVVTTYDGHPLAKQGKGGVALGLAAIGSFLAGTIGLDPAVDHRRAARQRRAGVRAAGILRHHGAGLRDGVVAGPRQHGEVLRLADARPAAGHHRPGRGVRPGPPHLGHHGADRRHRLHPRRGRPVRPRRDPVRHLPPAAAGRDQQYPPEDPGHHAVLGGSQADLGLDDPRRLRRLLPRHPAGRRRHHRLLRLLRPRKAALQDPGEVRHRHAGRRRRPGIRQQLRQAPAPSCRCWRWAFPAPPPPRC